MKSSALIPACKSIDSVDITPSWLYQLLIIVTHGLGVVGVAFLDQAWFIRLILIMLLMISCAWKWRSYLCYTRCSLGFGAGGWTIDNQAIQLLADNSFYPAFLVLVFRREGQSRVERLFLLPDSAPREQLRRLRVALLTSRLDSSAI